MGSVYTFVKVSESVCTVILLSYLGWFSSWYLYDILINWGTMRTFASGWCSGADCLWFPRNSPTNQRTASFLVTSSGKPRQPLTLTHRTTPPTPGSGHRFYSNHVPGAQSSQNILDRFSCPLFSQVNHIDFYPQYFPSRDFNKGCLISVVLRGLGYPDFSLYFVYCTDVKG